MDTETAEGYNWSFHEIIGAVFIDHLDYFLKEVMSLDEEDYDLRFAFNTVEFNNKGNKRLIVLVDVAGISDATNFFPNETGSTLYTKGLHTFLLSTNVIINFITPNETEGYRLATQYFMQLKKYKNTFEKFFHEVEPAGIGSAMIIQDNAKILYNIPVQADVLFNYEIDYKLVESIFEKVKVIANLADEE